MELITGKTGLPHVYAIDDAELYKLFVGDGAFVLPTGNKLNAEMNGTQELRLYDGSLIMQGRLCKTRPSDGYDALSFNAGVIGQKRVDLVVAEYSKMQEEYVEAYIVGDAPLAIDWLSLEESGTAFTPVAGQLYKLMNTVGEYTEGSYYRWFGNVYVQTIRQELESVEAKVIQGSYSATTYIEPEITTGDIDLGQTHQVKLWAVRFDGINFDGLVDYRLFLTDTPYNTLIATSLAVKEQADAMIADLSEQIEQFAEDLSSSLITGRVLYSVVEQLDEIQSGSTLVFDLGSVTYSAEAGDSIELYINGLKTNPIVDDYEVTVANNHVTFTFDSSRAYTSYDYGELIIRRSADIVDVDDGTDIDY